jgi:hypothetical protein
MMPESKQKKDFFINSNKFYFLIGLVVGMALLAVIGISSFSKNNYGKSKEGTNWEFDYKIVPPPLPKELKFAGEKVPMGNFEVAERIDRELIINVFWNSSTILAIKRANRWFPVIEPILKKNNIPDDFKYIPLIESNLSNTVSSAGAVGFWQFIEDQAKKYGLEVNTEVDERYNVEKSTEAACKYIKDSYDEFKSWTLAAASFNMGVNGLNKQITRQKVHNYYDLLLSDETSRYIPRIVAMKEIYTHQEKYGYYISKNELYPPLDTYEIEINSSVKNWANFALQRNINYKILKYFNPWLRDTTLTNKSGKTYLIKMPVKGSLEPVTNN